MLQAFKLLSLARASNYKVLKERRRNIRNINFFNQLNSTNCDELKNQTDVVNIFV